MKASVILFLLFFGFNLKVTPVFAQDTKQVTNQNLAWYGYFNTLHFSDKIFLTTELQERHFIAPFAQNQFLVRTHLHFKLNEGWDIAPGFCLFLQNTND